MNGPSGREDAKNFSLVTGTGILALLITAGLLYAAQDEPANRTVVHEVVVKPRVVVEPVEVEVEVEPVEEVVVETKHSGNDRIYGHVLTRHGMYEGFIRWDRNEGAWSDLLDANKSGRQSGIRFGHVERIDVTGRSSADFTLKSGEVVKLGANATDLGTGLRALLVEDAQGGLVEFQWNDLEVIEFEEAPADQQMPNARLYGTMVTNTGHEFTGYVTWDVDEIYTSDVLDGREGSTNHKIPFGEISSIERDGSRGARVQLEDGRTLRLTGTNDVNSSNSGISVSDPLLGQVKVDWRDFGSVHFESAPTEAGYAAFDGGRAIEGTVLTRDGEEITGQIRWDRDEDRSWEMLDGNIRSIEFAIEFSNIARIERTTRGSLVTLRDGRSFELTSSNDVAGGNNGIEVRNDHGTYRVSWRDFSELRIQ